MTSWRRGREKKWPESDILKDVSSGMQGQHGREHHARQLEGFTPPLREYLPWLQNRGAESRHSHLYPFFRYPGRHHFFIIL